MSLPLKESQYLALRMAQGEVHVLAQAVEAAWALPEGEALEPADFEMLGPTTVRSSMQRLKVSGYKAFLSLDRGLGVLPRENDS